MKAFIKAVFILLITLQFHSGAIGQTESAPILFIYDASGSMWGALEGKTKKEIAADVLTNVVNQLPVGQKIGLMAYGHRTKGDCDDVELLEDLENDSKEKVNAAVSKINPLGKTPLARSATIAINSLRNSGAKATIILITDGIESCDGNICDVVSAAKEEGIDFKLHIVGFGLKEGESEQLVCAATAGGGQYYDAVNAEGLSDVLMDVTHEAVDDPEDNFSVYATKNGQAVDAWVRAYKTGTQDEIDVSRTYRDSGFIHLPAGKYDIAIQPLEDSDISGTTIQIEIKEGETGHQTVSFDAATLVVFTTNNHEGCDAIVKMYERTTGKVAAQTRTYGREKTMEVNPGAYDITFEALAIKGASRVHKMENISISAGGTESATHNFESGNALIGVRTSGGDLIDAAIDIRDMATNSSVAGGRTYTAPNNNPKQFVLSSGTYTVKITTLGAHKGNTGTFNMTILTGETFEKTLTY